MPFFIAAVDNDPGVPLGGPMRQIGTTGIADGVVANEDVRSMNASEAKDALEDCKRRMEWFKNFDPKSHRHISHLKKRIAALGTRLRALKE
jgi:hypothetical protein